MKNPKNIYKPFTIILIVALIVFGVYFGNFYFTAHNNFNSLMEKYSKSRNELSNTENQIMASENMIESCGEEKLILQEKFDIVIDNYEECSENLEEVSKDRSSFFINWFSATNYVGEYKIVCGPIANVNTSSTPLFIDIGQSYPSKKRFTIVTWDTIKFNSLFTNIGINDELCVIGEINIYNGIPQIIVDEFSQFGRGYSLLDYLIN